MMGQWGSDRYVGGMQWRCNGDVMGYTYYMQRGSHDDMCIYITYLTNNMI